MRERERERESECECVEQKSKKTLEDQKGCIRGYEEFKYFGVKIDQEDTQGNYIKNIINKDRTITAMLNSVL